MRRAPALLTVVALAGCGGSKPATSVKDEARKRVREAQSQVDKALKDLDKTDLPEDLKRELREAKRLLDEAD